MLPCSSRGVAGPTRLPVTEKTVGSNPIGSAQYLLPCSSDVYSFIKDPTDLYLTNYYSGLEYRHERTNFLYSKRRW